MLAHNDPFGRFKGDALIDEDKNYIHVKPFLCLLSHFFVVQCSPKYRVSNAFFVQRQPISDLYLLCNFLLLFVLRSNSCSDRL